MRPPPPARAVATSQPDMMWLPVIGLDRHTPIMGVRVLRDGLPREPLQGRPGRWQEAVYRPISEFRHGRLTDDHAPPVKVKSRRMPLFC